MNSSATGNPIRPFGSRAAAVLFIFILIGVGSAVAEWGLMRPSDDPADNKAQLAAARAEAEASMPRLDPDVEEKLSTSDLARLVPAAVTFDPYVDRAGISGAKTPGTPQTATRGKAATPDPNAPPPVPDLSARAAAWRVEADRADKSRTARPARARMFLVSEVSPYGKMGPRGREDVLFRLESTKGELAARVGTEFYDGVLVDTNDEGAVFRTKSGTTRVVKWSRRRDADEKLQPAATPAAGPNSAAQNAPPGGPNR